MSTTKWYCGKCEKKLKDAFTECECENTKKWWDIEKLLLELVGIANGTQVGQVTHKIEEIKQLFSQKIIKKSKGDKGRSKMKKKKIKSKITRSRLIINLAEMALAWKRDKPTFSTIKFIIGALQKGDL